MTKKDYKAIAATFKLCHDSYLRTARYGDAQVLKDFARNIACTLAADNPGFNKAKFMEACNV